MRILEVTPTAYGGVLIALDEDDYQRLRHEKMFKPGLVSHQKYVPDKNLWVRMVDFLCVEDFTTFAKEWLSARI